MVYYAVARLLLLSTVFLWTVPPTFVRAVAVVEACNTCPVELNTDVELDQFSVMCLPPRMADVAIHPVSAAFAVIDAARADDTHVGSRLHLRGPPAVSFS